MNILKSFQGAKLRVLTGTIVGGLMLFCVVRGGIALLLLTLVFVCLGSKEYVDILKKKGFLPFFKVIVTTGVLLTFLTSIGYYKLVPLVLAGGVIASFLAVLFRGRQPYIANVATTMLGFAFAWLPSYIILIRQFNSDGHDFFTWNFNSGMYYLIFMFFVILMTDIGAYFFGTRFGKTKLAEVISPKKTVEGSVAGSICAIIVALIMGHFIGLTWIQSFVAGLLITIFAQLGDLSESLIKRDAGVKDSGDSIPGHGGFLDRADSYIFSAPVAYYYFNYFVVNQYSLMDIFDLIKKVLNANGF
ncbi:MAG: phosphatidate cytidylyltransferase [Candidatus Gastranaerophilales bacterium]|nr:phosphatidate cytidylyltransferase [Candidatus Gastranaerophilales bacterium]